MSNSIIGIYNFKIKRMMMTFRKILFSTLAAVALCSCGNDKELEIADRGYFLYFCNRAVDEIKIEKTQTHEGLYDGLRVGVGTFPADSPLLKGNSWMEQQVKEYVAPEDPDGKQFSGMMPIPINYTAEACESIKLLLYDHHDELLSDITPMARFHYVIHEDHPSVFEKLEKAIFLFNSDKELLGRVEEGSTLVDYLAKRPMMFVRALFTFPGLDTSLLQDGNHVKVEVRLANGTVLTADTNDTQE